MSAPNTTLTDHAAQELVQAIRKELARLRKRLVAIARDIDRVQDAKKLHHQAELLVRTKLPGRGAISAEVIDYERDPPEILVIALDPTLDPRAQVESWFKTSRRYQRGANLGQERAAITRADMEFLGLALTHLEDPERDLAALSALLTDSRIAKLMTPLRPRLAPTGSTASRRPYREFVGYAGMRILVGRGARDNDELTTRIAKPQDMFLHVQGATGAHVIVPRNKGETLAPELLVDAALLAHHFSAVATDARSDVSYAERRYVQKRRGAAAGSVNLLRHKVLHLMVDAARLAALIAAEVR